MSRVGDSQDPSKAYAVAYYDVIDDSVKLGEGTYSKSEYTVANSQFTIDNTTYTIGTLSDGNGTINPGNIAVTNFIFELNDVIYEIHRNNDGTYRSVVSQSFTLTDGQAIATRTNLVDGNIPKWDATNYTLVDSGKKVSDFITKVSTADRVYGTDSQGNQTTYDKNSFGQVDDVQVNETSIVSNKIAKIPVATESDIVDMFATEGIDYVLYPTNNEYYVYAINNVKGRVIIPKSEYEGLPVSRFSATLGPFSIYNEIILPDSIKVIEGSFNQSNLSYINLDKVESIINGIQSTKIKSVNLSSMNYLTTSAFANNKYLTEILFGRRLSAIPNNCFEGCSSISKLSIPSNVSFIGSKAFGNTTGPMNLKEITFEHTNNDPLEITSGAFETKSSQAPSSVNVYYYGNQVVYDYFRGSESFPHTVDNMNILSLTDLSSQGD